MRYIERWDRPMVPVTIGEIMFIAMFLPVKGKEVLHLCTNKIAVGDSAFPFLHGGVAALEAKEAPWEIETYLTGWPNDPHIIEDMHYSDFKPYEIRTSKGFGPREDYFLVFKIPKGVTHLQSGQKMTEEEFYKILQTE